MARVSKKWIILAFGGIAVFLIVGVLVSFVLVSKVVAKKEAEKQRIQAQIEEHLNALREAGEPLTSEDLAERYPDPPPERDARLLIAPVVELLSVPWEPDNVPFLSEAEFPQGTQRLDDSMRSAIQDLLDANEAALSALEEIDLDSVWFANHLSQGITNYNNPLLGEMREMASLYCLNAVIRADDLDHAGAVRSLVRVSELRKLHRGPILIEHLVNKVLEGMFSETLERVLNVMELNDPELQTLDVLLIENSEIGLREVIAAARILSMELLETVRTTADQLVVNAGNPVEELFQGYIAERIYRDRDFCDYLKREREILDSFQLSSRQQLEWSETIESLWPEDPKDASIALTITASDAIVPQFKNLAEINARTRLASIAVALERFRLANDGQLPGSLEELAPEFLDAIPLDPFSDEPMIYQKLEPGYLIYSIGPDFKNGFGDKYSDDITFTVER